jgi:hypothetical protein
VCNRMHRWDNAAVQATAAFFVLVLLISRASLNALAMRCGSILSPITLDERCTISVLRFQVVTLKNAEGVKHVP